MGRLNGKDLKTSTLVTVFSVVTPGVKNIHQSEGRRFRSPCHALWCRTTAPFWPCLRGTMACGLAAVVSYRFGRSFLCLLLANLMKIYSLAHHPQIQNKKCSRHAVTVRFDGTNLRVRRASKVPKRPPSTQKTKSHTM